MYPPMAVACLGKQTYCYISADTPSGTFEGSNSLLYRILAPLTRK